MNASLAEECPGPVRLVFFLFLAACVVVVVGVERSPHNDNSQRRHVVASMNAVAIYEFKEQEEEES